jgi:hypothetical protein
MFSNNEYKQMNFHLVILVHEISGKTTFKNIHFEKNKNSYNINFLCYCLFSLLWSNRSHSFHCKFITLTINTCCNLGALYTRTWDQGNLTLKGLRQPKQPFPFLGRLP